MFLETPQIALQARAAAGVGKPSEILDIHYAELGDLGEGTYFRWAERIGFVTVHVVLAITILKKRKLAVVLGAGGMAALAILRKELIGPRFSFAEFLQFEPDTGPSLPIAVSGWGPLPTRAVPFPPPAGIAKIIDFGSVVASRHEDPPWN